jgi:hypothetical protein
MKNTKKKTVRRPAMKKPTTAETALTQIARELTALVCLTDAHAVEISRKIAIKLKTSADGLWTTGDGSRVPVASMSDQHVFYALAKARRGEYPDTYSRKVEVGVLESEALRRLLKVAV